MPEKGAVVSLCSCVLMLLLIMIMWGFLSGRLRQAISKPADYYTERTLPGLGANVLSFRNAEEGKLGR